MTQIYDPYRTFNFKVIMGQSSQIAAHFHAVSGLTVSVPAIKVREGGNRVTMPIPGYPEYGSVQLKWGVTTSHDLYDWFMLVVAGKRSQEVRRNVSILMLENDGTTEAMRWNLVDAWPTQWDGPPLDASAQTFAFETLTLVYSTLNRDAAQAR